MIQVECDCGRVIKTNDENAGKKARCPECGEVVQFPAARKSATSKSVASSSKSASSKPSVKSAKRRPPEDEDFDDGALDEEEEFPEDDDEEEELPRPKSKKGPVKKSSKNKGDVEGPPKKKKKQKSGDDAELNKKILIGSGVAAGLVVVGLVIFLITRMPGGGSAKVEVPQNFVAFALPQGEIRCDAPKDWPVKSGGGSGGVPPYASFDGGSVKVSFHSDQAGASKMMILRAGGNDESQLPDELKAVSKIHDENKRKFEEEMSGYQEQGKAVMIKTAGFGEGRVSEFTSTSVLSSVHGYRVTLLGNNNQYNLICQCPAGQWKAFEPVFKKIIESSGGF